MHNLPNFHRFVAHYRRHHGQGHAQYVHRKERPSACTWDARIVKQHVARDGQLEPQESSTKAEYTSLWNTTWEKIVCFLLTTSSLNCHLPKQDLLALHSPEVPQKAPHIPLIPTETHNLPWQINP